jgi:hypothetical protein
MFKNLQKMSTDFPDWYQAELNSNVDDTSVRQTIAKPNVEPTPTVKMTNRIKVRS